MRTTRLALLTGAAAIILGGYAGLAEAKQPDTHTLSIQLPNGQIEHIRYSGDIPPAVIVSPASSAVLFDPVSTFGMLDQISAAMDSQVAALFQDLNAMTESNTGGLGVIPALSGPGTGVCMRSVQITYMGGGQAPHVVSRTSGDCGPAGGEATTAHSPRAPEKNTAPDIVRVKSTHPYQGLVHPISDWHAGASQRQ